MRAIRCSICLEASEADAERTAWTSEVRLFHGYDESDPRPPGLRALDLARQLSSEYERVGIELSLGTQAADRMVGEPTTYPEGLVRRVPRGRRRDAAAGARARDQDRAGGRADAARERDRGRRDGARPGADPAGDARERGRRALERLGARSRHRLRGRARSSSRTASRSCGQARGSALSRPPAAARSRSTSRPSSRSGSSPTATGATTRRTSSRASSNPRYAELEQGLMGVYARRDRLRPAGSEPRRARPDDPRGPGRDRLSGAAEPSDLPRRRRPRARAALCAPGGRWHDRGRHGAGDRARGLLAGRRRPPRRGQLPDHRRRAPSASAASRTGS